MLRRVWLSLEIKMCDDKSLYSQYAHGFRSGTPMKLLGSLNSSMWCELETNPLRQRLHAGVAASKHLSCHPCVVFCDMYQGVLIFFFWKQTKWREQMNLLDTHTHWTEHKKGIHSRHDFWSPGAILKHAQITFSLLPLHLSLHIWQ